MVKFRVVTGPEAEKTKEQLRRFRENENVLDREWQSLLESHPDEWAVAYGKGTVVAVARLGDIHSAIPDEHNGSAAVRYITLDDMAWAL